MHVRRLLGAFSIGLTIAGIGAGGCGGSSFAQPAPDGGHTTADATAPQETGPEDAGADVACAVPINLETIVLPDAASWIVKSGNRRLPSGARSSSSYR